MSSEKAGAGGSTPFEVSRENMAQVALMGHARPKTQRVKARISQTISDHAVANTWWDPKNLPSWLTDECYAQTIEPLLRVKKLREIAETMQVSQPYTPRSSVRDDAAHIGDIGNRWLDCLMSRGHTDVIRLIESAKEVPNDRVQRNDSRRRGEDNVSLRC